MCDYSEVAITSFFVRVALESINLKLALISTICMSWISGNLDEMEGPVAKVNSWYVCTEMPNQTAGNIAIDID